MAENRTEAEERIYAVLDTVEDPEIPTISIVEMGMVRGVAIGDSEIIVSFAPTYSGCPALEVIERAIVQALHEAGYASVRIKRVLSPSWTTDWISESGKEKLRKNGISPPCAAPSELVPFPSPVGVAEHHARCPHCGSENTRCVNEFGSTPCKTLHYCNACEQPFEYFKPH